MSMLAPAPTCFHASLCVMGYLSATGEPQQQAGERGVGGQKCFNCEQHRSTGITLKVSLLYAENSFMASDNEDRYRTGMPACSILLDACILRRLRRLIVI